MIDADAPVGPVNTFAYAELADAAGQDLGRTGAVEVSQQMVDVFADLTGDHQWIHVDTQRAKVGPYGTTIVHGYLTLGLAPMFIKQLMTVTGIGMGLNYGVDRVRFTSPLPVGERIWGEGRIEEVHVMSDRTRIVLKLTVMRSTSKAPVLVAEIVLLYFPQGSAPRP